MKVASAVLKISIALGGTYVLIYSIRIGHFPQGLVLGDGLLFLLIAGCFGFIYTFFLVSLIGLGSCLRPLTKFVLGAVDWSLIKLRRKKTDLYETLEPFQFFSIFPAIMAILLIAIFSGRCYEAYVTYFFIAIVLYFFYSLAIKAEREISIAKKQKNTIVYIPGKAKALIEVKRHKNTYLMSCFLIPTFPLLIGGVFGPLADGAMRLAHVRIDNAVIHMKKPYSDFLPNSLIDEDLETPVGYRSYKNINVLFKGFGITTVIAFKDDATVRQLEIPNDQIIVEMRTIK